MHAGAQIDQPVRPLDQSGQHIGRQNIDGEDAGHARLGLDASRLAIADPGIVDHGVEAAEPVDLIGDARHARKGRKVAGNSGPCAWRLGQGVARAGLVSPVQDNLVTLLDQELPRHEPKATSPRLVERSMRIADRLAKSDPGNAGWQRDLSVSYDKVGDVLVEQGDLAGTQKSYRDSLAIRDRLAKSDPGNAGWQRDLSVSYDKVGDVLVEQGDLAGAQKSYRDSLAIRDRLAKSDPGNAGWKRDLSVSLNKVGDVQVEQGDLAGALKSYRDSLAIADRLAKSDPGNAGWQRDLFVSYEKVGSVYVKSERPGQARETFATGRAIIARLVADHPDVSAWKQDLERIDREIVAIRK